MQLANNGKPWNGARYFMGVIGTTGLTNGMQPELPLSASLSRLTTAANMQEEGGQLSGQDELSFTKLSSVLNGLKRGAAVMRARVGQLMEAVRSGSYHVDSAQISRSIIGDCLNAQR